MPEDQLTVLDPSVPDPIPLDVVGAVLCDGGLVLWLCGGMGQGEHLARLVVTEAADVVTVVALGGRVPPPPGEWDMWQDVMETWRHAVQLAQPLDGRRLLGSQRA